MNPTSILITGSKGMLGSDLTSLFSNLVGPQNIWATDYDTLDITQLETLRTEVRKREPQIILNAAAYTNVDGAEKEREKAYAINAAGTLNLVKVCQEIGAKLIHFTTDHVYDGSGNRPWTETDTPKPSNYYAETKLCGEQHALNEPSSLVLRVQWLYGKQRDRFTILRNQKEFTPFADQFGAPTWTEKLSELVAKLVEKNAQGLFHFAYDDYASWFDVFQFACEQLELDTRLIAKKTKEVTLPAKRPLYCVLSNKKLLNFLGLRSMGSWKDPLREFLVRAVT